MNVFSESKKNIDDPAVLPLRLPLWRIAFAMLLAAAFLFSAYTSYARFGIRSVELFLALSSPWVVARMLGNQNQACLSVSVRTVVWVLLISSVFVNAVTLAQMSIGIAIGLNISVASFLFLAGAANLALVGAVGGRMMSSVGFYALLIGAISCEFALVISRFPRVSPSLLVNLAYALAIPAWDTSVQTALGWRRQRTGSGASAGFFRVLIQTGLLAIILGAIAAIFIFLNKFLPIGNSL